ncbi:MAG: hypothetical protein IJZ77_02945 [Bacilli bacterium]|nr:hypothetical protein [Bacilli bacterium]
MKHYELESNEVVLYKGDVTQPNKKGLTQLILTNLNLVFIATHKKLFSKEQVTTETYPTNEIKIYNNIPQLKVNGDIVEIYLLSTDKEVKFPSKHELNCFINSANTLLTKKTKIERCAEKLKNTINLVNDTLEINTVESVSNVIKNGVIVTAGKGIGKVINKSVGLVSGVLKKKKPDTSNSK